MAETKTQRCLRLFLLLLERGRLSTSQAMRLLEETDKQKVLRDLHLLHTTIPSILHTGTGRDKTWVLSPSLELLRPTIQQAIALELGRELTGFLSGSGLQAGLEGVSSRMLEESLRGFQTKNLSRKFCLQHEPHRSYTDQQDVILEVLDGLLRERSLQIKYKRADGTERLHEALWPLTLVVYRRALYLLVTRADGRTFDLSIDRILSVVSGERFEYPADWRPDTVLGRRFGMVTSGEPERVVLRFAPEMARWVTDRIWHPTQEITHLEDGRLELVMMAAGKELKRLVLEWGEYCEVIAPVSLREEIARTVQKMAEIYETNKPPQRGDECD